MGAGTCAGACRRDGGSQRHGTSSLGISFLFGRNLEKANSVSLLYFFPSKYSRKRNKISEIIFAASWCSLKDQWVLLPLNSPVSSEDSAAPGDASAHFPRFLGAHQALSTFLQTSEYLGSFPLSNFQCHYPSPPPLPPIF